MTILSSLAGSCEGPPVRPTVIVAGYLVRNPLGGHMLSILHWLVGLRRLGFDVVFVEHHGWRDACYDAERDLMTDDPSFGIMRVQNTFAQYGLDRWCYVDADENYHGMSREEVAEACGSAAMLLALWLTTWLDEFRACRRRVFIDTDPGFTQFGLEPGAQSRGGYASPYDFDTHFTYGTRIGGTDCPIPTRGLHWLPIRPPVALELVPVAAQPLGRRFTTVMSWNNRALIVYEGEAYGQKDVEFERFIDLPTRIGPVLEVALAGKHAPRERIAAAGWRVEEARLVTETPESYLRYIANSRGEFSVAVNLEVKSRSGWFSDRTAAYLASGRPAIVQDTGFSDALPVGSGLFAFSAVEDVVSAIAAVDADPAGQAAAARQVAERWLDSDRVIGDLLRAASIPMPAAVS